jgi:hypothetical protein
MAFASIENQPKSVLWPGFVSRFEPLFITSVYPTPLPRDPSINFSDLISVPKIPVSSLRVVYEGVWTLPTTSKASS